jgi:nicotinate-nucleotide adenylyltransferase
MWCAVMAIHGPDILPARIHTLATAGGRIGLLGGSFNPAHTAHLHISLIALRRLRLDAVWWLVSPQNPLKPVLGMASLERRLARAREVALHPKIEVSAVESALGTRYSVDTVSALQSRFPVARFVWIMGGDSLASFHLWRRWEQLFSMVPIAIVARPGFTIAALSSPAAIRFQPDRVRDDAGLADMAAPAWVFLQERLDATSATAIRRSGAWE